MISISCIDSIGLKHVTAGGYRRAMTVTTIRLATPDDGAALAAIYAPSVVDSPISFEAVPPDADEMARRVAAAVGHAPWLVLERDGVMAGYAYASRHRERAAYLWSIDTSVYVAPAHQRTGV